mmetsp:Transcript_26878/g.42646  ORF Transcript_26878/g.42646 Transcript_26878/m.42646 type:complete len:232 (+) Transcript_26878:92-787(+)
MGLRAHKLASHNKSRTGEVNLSRFLRSSNLGHSSLLVKLVDPIDLCRNLLLELSGYKIFLINRAFALQSSQGPGEVSVLFLLRDCLEVLVQSSGSVGHDSVLDVRVNIHLRVVEILKFRLQGVNNARFGGAVDCLGMSNLGLLDVVVHSLDLLRNTSVLSVVISELFNNCKLLLPALDLLLFDSVPVAHERLGDRVVQGNVKVKDYCAEAAKNNDLLIHHKEFLRNQDCAA